MNLKTSAFVLVLIGLLLPPLQTWLALGGDLREYLDHETLRGQVPYLMSKLFALYAIELVWLQAMLGLLRPWVAQADWIGPAAWARVHRASGLLALVSMGAHVALFVVATSMRNNAPALDLLLPWGRGVYRTWVAFGAVSFWLLVIASTVQLARLSNARSRLWLHRLALLALGLLAIHSLTIGSESRSGSMIWTYGFMGATLCAAAVGRLFTKPQGRRQKVIGLAPK